MAKQSESSPESSKMRSSDSGASRLFCSLATCSTSAAIVARVDIASRFVPSLISQLTPTHQQPPPSSTKPNQTPTCLMQLLCRRRTLDLSCAAPAVPLRRKQLIARSASQSQGLARPLRPQIEPGAVGRKQGEPKPIHAERDTGRVHQFPILGANLPGRAEMVLMVIEAHAGGWPLRGVDGD